ncbi:hypothetical protein FRC04_011857 [Tulasnella sp. 424]|nr:hypothetical protein FRC04_011857 [Tulasnella sp. 424]KAG8971410.1 hypothetical protein FRC05_011089 [Tulasnella sp. 425]
MSASIQTPAERWIDLTDDELTPEIIEEILPTISDDVWVAAACVDRVVDDVEAQRCLIRTGLSRTEEASKEAKKAVDLARSLGDDQDGGDAEGEYDPSTLEFDDGTPELLVLRRTLLQRSDLTETYAAMATECGWSLSRQTEEGSDDPTDQGSSSESTDVEDLDLDPWADVQEEEPRAPSSPQADSGIPPPISLSTFLLTPTLETALLFASTLEFSALRILIKHNGELLPHRWKILATIPLHVLPSELSDILSTFDYAAEKEKPPASTPWRAEPEWVETSESAPILQSATLPVVAPLQSDTETSPLLQAVEFSAWYVERVRRIDAELGLVDVALAWVQHGASQGIPGLDELGEDLSLLARLVYETSSAADRRAPTKSQWNLSKWQQTDAKTIMHSYLANSTPDTIASDIRRLVLPYLYVLEVKQERTGKPDPTIPTRYLYDYILSSPLPVVAAIFEASKPVLPASQRLIKKNDDMSRLALACLYGSDELHEWGTMTRIFESLPGGQASPTSDDEMAEEAADMTLRAMADFVTPSATRGKATPQELLLFFKPLPVPSLSRALDILDIHLESGEIFDRWDVPAPLRWFLQSGDNVNQQKAWATRMARRNTASSGDEQEDEDEWVDLMNDMVRLAGGKEGLLKGAFGLLTTDEVKKIFFEGLLSLGKFQLAKRLLNPRKGSAPLSDQTIEEICLSMSREFYDNASSGNLHNGDMKNAYECLSVTKPTPTILAEREFIEATSKICSYGVQSRPGVPLAPIEIRLVKDRLSLVARVLSSTENVYKHEEVVLDIVRKLGFRKDIAAEVKALAMLADAATQAEDFGKAAELSERMVRTTRVLRETVLQPTASDEVLASEEEVQKAQEAVEVCWHTCFQLGRQPEFPEVKRKLALLGFAMQLCPAENVLDVLAVWRRVESEAIDARGPRTGPNGRRRHAERTKPLSRAGGLSALSAAAGRLPSLSAHLLSMPNTPALPIGSADAAAMASRTFNRMADVAAHLPFSLGGRSGSRTRDGGRDSPRPASEIGSEVSNHARAALARGVGWLIGADDD